MSAPRPPFDVHGHRGARGLLPENSIRGFLRALELGATTLEMDVVVSRDRKVVVSHDFWFSSEFCATPSGERIDRRRQYDLRIFQMDYDEVRKFDCGLRNPRFATQVPGPAYKPLLSEVIERAEAFTLERGLASPRYGIEVKSAPESDGLLHPPPSEFSDLVLDVVGACSVADRSIILSFDPRILRIARASTNRPRLAFLVSSYDHLGVQADLRILGFVPEVYGPTLRVVTRRLVDEAHRSGMKVVPWTVNRRKDMERMMEWGTDGLITDYPDAALALL